jgi:hypothetical protein
MKFYIVLISILLGYACVQAQTIDVALAAKRGIAPSISIDKFYGKKFRIGLGIRTTAFVGGQQNYITAPAMLTSGKRSLAAFFTEYKNEKLDTLTLSHSTTCAINTKLSFEYNFRKGGIGFNIDVAGFTIGPKQKSNFWTSENITLNNTNQVAKPTPYNFLLISDSDRGSLNSELYYKRQILKKNSLRFGLSFQFVEYKTNKKLTFDNDRFRYKTLMPFIAYSFQPFNKNK